MDNTHCSRIRYWEKWRRHILRHILTTIIYSSSLVIVYFVLISHCCKHKKKKKRYVNSGFTVSLVPCSGSSMYSSINLKHIFVKIIFSDCKANIHLKNQTMQKNLGTVYHFGEKDIDTCLEHSFVN